MALTPSTMSLAPGEQAPDFTLLDVSTGGLVTLSDFITRPLLVMFICNHCPYVIHLREALANFAHEYKARGLAIVGISSNDVTTHPADGPEAMAQEKASAGYVFPYLYDETQAVAKAYHAACTPDFFVFGADHRLVYRGRFDETRPGGGKPHGADLRRAADVVLAGQPFEGEQVPSMGCNIKWKPGHAPSAFGS